MLITWLSLSNSSSLRVQAATLFFLIPKDSRSERERNVYGGFKENLFVVDIGDLQCEINDL